MKGSKICGISDLTTLNYIINHPYSPNYIGFIVNFSRSPRFIKFDKLTELLNEDKKNCKFTAVLVKPSLEILEKIKDLPFDYYQIYDCTAEEIQSIKNDYNKKIIVALTISDQKDIEKYKDFEDIADILLFDSKGYERSESFNHELLNNVNTSKPIMVAGDIKTNDLVKFKDTPYLVDISGHLESKKGVKDLNKIDKFLNTVHNINL
jgi:phosphoribosylanthranilate isomerase